MLKFYRTPILGAISTPQHFITRQVVISIPVRNWLGIMNRQEPERRAAVWAEIEAESNKERPVSNDIQIIHKVFGDRQIDLIAGTKITGNSPVSGKLSGEFKFIIVDHADLMETLRRELGVKIPKGKSWDQVRQFEVVERR